jgi:hypothetical protein
MRSLSPLFWVVLVGVVLVELAILVPVIVTQRARDESLISIELDKVTQLCADRLHQTIDRFVYNVVRAAAAAPKTGLLSQQDLEDAIQLDEDPRQTPELLYFWIPYVSAADRAAYEHFYRLNVTGFANGTTKGPVVPVSDNRTCFAPYTVFVPPLPSTANPAIFGFDLLPFNATASQPFFRNASKYLLIPSGLVTSTANNFGFIAVAQNKYGRGWMFGRVGSGELLAFALTPPRELLTVAAFVPSRNASRQVLYYDLSPLLGNVSSLAMFEALPDRRSFYTANFTTLGETILVAIRYDPAYAADFAGNTWCDVLSFVCNVLSLLLQG